MYTPVGKAAFALSCLHLALFCKMRNLLRNTALNLRFPLLVYVYVHSRRESRIRLVLLASCFVLKNEESATQYGIAGKVN